MRGPSWVTGAVVAAAGAALLGTWAARAGEPAARVAGADRPVSARAGDRGDISAHNSPTVARNPRRPANLAVTSRIDTPRFSCALRVSHDGGLTWRSTRIPIPRGEQPKCYAPDAAFAADGTLHVSYVTLRGIGNVPNAVWLAGSGDGGRTLQAPRRVAGRLAFQVRLATDPADARRLYLTWLQAREVGPLRFTTPGNPLVAVRSDDGGRSFSRPVRLSSPQRERVLAGTPAVGPGRDLYVLFLDVGEDRLDYEGGHDAMGGPPYAGRFSLVLGRSRDGGRRWEESVVDDGVVPTRRFVAFLPPFPSLAVDRRDGRIHAVFDDARHGDADVWIRTLRPGASTWTKRLRVNDTDAGDGSQQYLPQVAVAPGGRVDVVYYDRRADPGGRRTELSLQSSGDGADSFGERIRLSSRAFDGGIGAGSERGMPDPGSRLGLISEARRAFAVWSDTRAGTEASNKQDLRGVPVAFPGPGGGRRIWLAAGGAALLALGLGLGVGRRPARL